MASTFAVQCPSCDRSFTVSERARGKSLSCPHCDEPVSVPVQISPPVVHISGSDNACRRCGSTLAPVMRGNTTCLGWGLFLLLLFLGLFSFGLTLLICWAPLLLRDYTPRCPRCGGPR